jgi:hypothetical protein
MKLKIIEQHAKYVLCINSINSKGDYYRKDDNENDDENDASDANVVNDEVLMIIIVNEPMEHFNNILIQHNVTSLVLCSEFNQPIDYLPINIEKLYMKRLYECHFICEKEDIVTKDKKKNLMQLFSMRCPAIFNHPINNLPIGLKILVITWEYFYFNHSLDYLPAGLEELNIHLEYVDKMLDNLPIGLKTLSIQFNEPTIVLKNLPNGLTDLYIDSYNQNWTCNLTYLPQSIIVLDLGFHFYDSLEHLPANLEELLMHNRYFDIDTFLKPYTLPESLKLFVCYFESNMCQYIKQTYGIQIYFDDEDRYW